MKIRILPLSVGLALTISLSSAVQVMLPNAQHDEAWNDVEFIDITSFVRGETLSVDLGNSPADFGDRPLRPVLSDNNSLLRSEVNVHQLIALNARKQRIEEHSKEALKRMAKKLPKYNKYGKRSRSRRSMRIDETEGFFANSNYEGTNSVDELLQYAKQYRGTPYRRGGLSSRGFDCSGFTQTAFRHIGVTLPRTSHSQSQLGRVVSVDEAQPGDMIFFGRKRRGSYRTDHAGIVVENNNGAIKIIHSSSRGVVIEDVFSVQSYRRKFLFIKRVL